MGYEIDKNFLEEAEDTRQGIKLEKGVLLTENKVIKNFDLLQNYMNFFCTYPDLFVDLITPKSSNFKLFPYQRIFLRVCLRYREVSGTFPRAYSKSFLDFLAMNVRGIVQPRSKGFTCADTKKQAAQIVEEKTNEIYRLFPFLVNELKISDIDKAKGKYGNMGSDYAELKFRNDSQIDIVNTGNAGRGGRRHWGTLTFPRASYTNVFK